MIRGILAFLLVFAAGTGLLEVALNGPAETRRAYVLAHLESQRAEVRALEATAARRDEFERQLSAQQARAAELQRWLPDQHDPDRFADDVRGLAHEVGVEVISLHEGDTSTGDVVTRIPVSLELRGRPSDQVALATRLEQNHPLVVRSLKGGADGRGTAAVEIDRLGQHNGATPPRQAHKP